MTTSIRTRTVGALTLAAGVIVLGGCSFVGTPLDGVTATETRALDGFDRIDITGSGEVDVVVGERQTVTVTADTALIDGVRTSVEGRVLDLAGPSGTWGWSDQDVHYVVTVPSLTALELSGSGDVTVDGVDAEALAVELTGSGEITLAGAAEELHLAIDGSGRILADELIARAAAVDLSGSGDVVVSAHDRLDVDVSGSGDVTYLGEAEVQAEVSGSGEVRQG